MNRRLRCPLCGSDHLTGKTRRDSAMVRITCGVCAFAFQVGLFLLDENGVTVPLDEKALVKS